MQLTVTTLSLPVPAPHARQCSQPIVFCPLPARYQEPTPDHSVAHAGWSTMIGAWDKPLSTRAPILNTLDWPSWPRGAWHRLVVNTLWGRALRGSITTPGSKQGGWLSHRSLAALLAANGYAGIRSTGETRARQSCIIAVCQGINNTIDSSHSPYARTTTQVLVEPEDIWRRLDMPCDLGWSGSKTGTGRVRGPSANCLTEPGPAAHCTKFMLVRPQHECRTWASAPANRRGGRHACWISSRLFVPWRGRRLAVIYMWLNATGGQRLLVSKGPKAWAKNASICAADWRIVPRARALLVCPGVVCDLRLRSCDPRPWVSTSCWLLGSTVGRRQWSSLVQLSGPGLWQR